MEYQGIQQISGNNLCNVPCSIKEEKVMRCHFKMDQQPESPSSVVIPPFVPDSAEKEVHQIVPANVGITSKNESSDKRPPVENETVFRELQQIFREIGIDLDPQTDLDKITKMGELLLKIAKDSQDNQGVDFVNDEGPKNPKKKIDDQVCCKIGLDAFGEVKYVGENAKQVFGTRDLKGFNFFDDLMAAYNKSYFKQKFGEHPLLGLKKPTTILRFSLEHMDEDMNPVVLTCKVTLIYSSPKPGQPRRVKGAKILARRSSDESTKNFQNKVRQGTIEAGALAIQHLKYLHTIKQQVKDALNGSYQLTGSGEMSSSGI